MDGKGRGYVQAIQVRPKAARLLQYSLVLTLREGGLTAPLINLERLTVH